MLDKILIDVDKLSGILYVDTGIKAFCIYPDCTQDNKFLNSLVYKGVTFNITGKAGVSISEKDLDRILGIANATSY